MNPLAWFKKKEIKLNDDGTPAPPMSEGEKWYNRIVYQGINYWLNLGISLVVTDYFLHGKGANLYKKSVEHITGGLTGAGLNKPLAKWLAGVGAGTFSLNSGGNILLIPTKFPEDNKRNIVHWLNDKLGVDQTAPDGHKKTPDEIYIEQEQPKQSWGRMIWRRFLAWGATTVVGMSLDKFGAQKLPSPKMVDGEMVTHKGGQDVFTDWTKKNVNAVLTKVGGKSIVENDKAQRYMGYAALDWIYTIITSSVLHATNGAGKMKAPHEIGDDDAPAANVEIGDSLKAGEHLEVVAVPDKPKASPDLKRNKAEIIKAKPSEENFAQAAQASRSGEQLQLGA